ncbi:MAG: alpha-amylase family glycosyl hydrolase, partial [Bacteroidota bacterium]|nr:alpha-amylase family glycosyl hydrolase [Bacteroidota bacterium]
MSNKHKHSTHPKWSYSSNIYEVNLRQYTQEGTFDAFARHLPRLKDMGVQILWFMPITPISEKDRLGSLGSYYAVKNYKETNPEYGSVKDFAELVKEAHDFGFKIIIDWVSNHTGNDHHWINDHPEYYCYNEDQSLHHPHGWSDVSQLNYENEDLRDDMISAMKYWLKECDIDGFRCDMAHLVPLDFWETAKKKLSKTKENLFWLAECEVPEYHAVFDATYTWRWMHASEEFYHSRMNLQSFLTVLYKSVTEFPCNAFRVYFTSNHDENSWNGTQFEKYGDAARLMAVFTCTWNGMPMIYSGQELPNKKRLKFFDKDPIEWDGNFELHDFYKTLLILHSANDALRAGDPDVLTKIVSHPDDHEIFSYLRKNGPHQVLVILNCSP